MTDWIKTAQRVAAIIATLVASMVAWWNLGLPGLVFSPDAPIHARIEALERLNRDTRVKDMTVVTLNAPAQLLAGGAADVQASA